MFEDRYDPQRKKYALNGESRAGVPEVSKAGVPSRPVTSSSFLTRIAEDVKRPNPASQHATGSRHSSSIDHSSPAANLKSRLRWVETAFKTDQTTVVSPTQQTEEQQPQTQSQNSGTIDCKRAVSIMRKRMQNMRIELDQLDGELEEIEKRLSG
ncbi:MAG: hypothetical protein JW724_03835 [Candidatus Altiarchaeota archaeon]|nr:hypothetical protein [Candidatus Altiarchaeota archaeon]